VEQYELFNQVQNRLVAVMGMISSIDEAAWNAAARQLGIPDQQTELDQLAGLFQGSLKIRDHYFQATSDSILSTVSRGVSMLGRYWGFDDMSAQQAINGLDQEIGTREKHLAAVEGQANVQGSTTFVERPLPGGDPLLVGREEQKQDLKDALSSWWPYLIGVVLVLYLLRRYL
jgi:hypothetical protein